MKASGGAERTPQHLCRLPALDPTHHVCIDDVLSLSPWLTLREHLPARGVTKRAKGERKTEMNWKAGCLSEVLLLAVRSRDLFFSVKSAVHLSYNVQQ